LPILDSFRVRTARSLLRGKRERFKIRDLSVSLERNTDYTDRKPSPRDMANLDLLRKSLIGLIDTDLDSHGLLERMARTIGENLGVSACLLVAGMPATTPTPIGFWHENHLSLPSIARALSLAYDPILLGTGRGIELGSLPGVDLDWWARMVPLTSSWALGITFRGVRHGIIAIGTSDPDRVTGIELESLGEIASTLGLAYHTLPIDPESLPTLERGKINFSPPTGQRGLPAQGNPLVMQLYQLMRQQLEQQRQLNERLDDIITAMSDRARNPLATMKMAIEAMSDSRRQLSPASREQYWGILKHEWNTINQLIDNIIILKQLQSREISVCPQPVNLETLLDETTTPWQRRWSEDQRKLLSLKIACPPPGEQTRVETDPLHLRKILEELLSNAEKFSRSQTTVAIEVKGMGEEEIGISVSDTGLGIAPEERELIFEPFRRGRGITDRAIPGTGIGLAIVKGLLEVIHGRIEVTWETSSDSEGTLTQFTVILPRSFPRNRPG
jgi:signal transduction histidine kinase